MEGAGWPARRIGIGQGFCKYVPFLRYWKFFSGQNLFLEGLQRNEALRHPIGNTSREEVAMRVVAVDYKAISQTVAAVLLILQCMLLLQPLYAPHE